MCSNNEIYDYLKYSLQHHLERIKTADNKAGILIAIQAILFATAPFVFEKCIAPLNNSDLNKLCLISGIILASVALLFIALLLQVIRPAKYFLCLFTKNKPEKSNGILYLNRDMSEDEDDFISLVSKIDLSGIIDDLSSVVLVHRKLVRAKYSAYRYALLVAKIELILATIIGLTMLFLVY